MRVSMCVFRLILQFDNVFDFKGHDPSPQRKLDIRRAARASVGLGRPESHKSHRISPNQFTNA